MHNIWKHPGLLLGLFEYIKFVGGKKKEGIPRSRKDLTGGPFLSLAANLPPHLPFWTVKWLNMVDCVYNGILIVSWWCKQLGTYQNTTLSNLVYTRIYIGPCRISKFKRDFNWVPCVQQGQHCGFSPISALDLPGRSRVSAPIQKVMIELGWWRGVPKSKKI